MPTLRCSICGIDWPAETKYETCEGCGLKTSPVSNISAMADDEARALWSQLHFAGVYDETQPPKENPKLDAVLDKRFTLEKWQAQVREDRAKQAEKDAQRSPRPVKHVLPSSNPVFRLRTPS